MISYSFPCPLPTPGISSFLEYHQFSLQGWKKGERPLKRDLYLSQQIKQPLWHAREQLGCLQTLALVKAMLMEATQEITSQIPASSIIFVN